MADQPTERILKGALDSLLDKNEFKPRDIVRWKPGLKNKRRPRDGQLAIVIEYLQTYVHDETKDAGSTYYREPLDLILGLIDDEDGQFNIYYFDSRRFEKV